MVQFCSLQSENLSDDGHERSRAAHKGDLVLTVTERARKHLAGVLAHWKCKKEVGVRFVGSGDIVLDVALPDDTVFYHQGRKILFLDPEMCRFLQASQVDLEGSPGLQRLRIRRILPRTRGLGAVRRECPCAPEN